MIVAGLASVIACTMTRVIADSINQAVNITSGVVIHVRLSVWMPWYLTLAPQLPVERHPAQ
jgi:hypothetical protein